MYEILCEVCDNVIDGIYVEAKSITPYSYSRFMFIVPEANAGIISY
jgi:hypothetical protein